MTTMIVEVYDALKSAGAEDGKARAAAASIADYQRDIAELKPDMRLVKWMLGFVLAGVAVLIAKAFAFV
jgi:hypothetical protein